MIRGVVFDFGNVVCRFDPMIFVHGVAPWSSKPVPELGKILRNSPDLFVDYETGRITSATFFELMCVRCGLSCTQEQFITAFASIFSPIPETFRLIRSLRGRYRLGLLSNTSDWHFRFGIVPTGILSAFDAVTLSYDVGVMKPDPAIYHDMLDKLALPAGDCIFIDDLEENTAAATALGMKGIHYVGHDDLVARLADTGVETPGGEKQ
jgi:putative hydrolase of the HAD superfamily